MLPNKLTIRIDNMIIVAVKTVYMHIGGKDSYAILFSSVLCILASDMYVSRDGMLIISHQECSLSCTLPYSRLMLLHQSAEP